MLQSKSHGRFQGRVSSWQVPGQVPGQGLLDLGLMHLPRQLELVIEDRLYQWYQSPLPHAHIFSVDTVMSALTQTTAAGLSEAQEIYLKNKIIYFAMRVFVVTATGPSWIEIDSD